MPQETLGELFTSVINKLPTSADINTKANATDPVFTNSISMGRKANTTIGEGSVATGTAVSATALGAHAEGYETLAGSLYAHAEGCGSSSNYSYQTLKQFE